MKQKNRVRRHHNAAASRKQSPKVVTPPAPAAPGVAPVKPESESLGVSLNLPGMAGVEVLHHQVLGYISQALADQEAAIRRLVLPALDTGAACEVAEMLCLVGYSRHGSAAGETNHNLPGLAGLWPIGLKNVLSILANTLYQHRAAFVARLLPALEPLARLHMAEALALAEAEFGDENGGTEYDTNPRAETALVKLALEARADVLLGPSWRRDRARAGRGKAKRAGQGGGR